MMNIAESVPSDSRNWKKLIPGVKRIPQCSKLRNRMYSPHDICHFDQDYVPEKYLPLTYLDQTNKKKFISVLVSDIRTFVFGYSLRICPRQQ